MTPVAARRSARRARIGLGVSTASVVAALQALAPSPACASPAAPSDADRATARALAREGYEAHKAGQDALAVDRFTRAEALVHAPTLLLGLARAEAGLGKLVEAQETYTRVVREPITAQSPAPFAKAVQDAKHELAELTPRLAWVTIDVRGPTAPQVLLDDAPVPVAALGVRRACNPGSHQVKASAAGWASAQRAFGVADGGSQAVTIQMVAEPVLAPIPPGTFAVENVPAVGAPSEGETPAGLPQGEADGSSPWQTKAAIAAFGVGGAGLVVGGITGILTLAKHGTLSDECPNGVCPASHASDVASYRTIANVSTIALIVGAAGAATGVTLLLTAPKQPTLSAYAGVGDVGLEGTF